MLTRRTPLKRGPWSKASVSAGARSVPIARTVSLSRSTPMRRGGTRKDEPTPAELAHMAAVRELQCCALGAPGHDYCTGPMVAHHAGRHGTGTRSSHYDTVPLCDTAHSQLHDMPGNGWTAAAGLDGEGIRALEDIWIRDTHELLGVDSDGPIGRLADLLPF